MLLLVTLRTFCVNDGSDFLLVFDLIKGSMCAYVYVMISKIGVSATVSAFGLSAAYLTNVYKC